MLYAARVEDAHGLNESPAPAGRDAAKQPPGTSLLLWRSCAMGRPAISTRAASIWQRLASAIAILAVAMFVTHAAAAKDAVSQAHDHTAARAGPSLIVADAPAEPGWSHGASSVVGHKHGTTDDGTPPCCEEACLVALMPATDTHLDERWGVRSKPLMVVASLAGHDPEGLRRPPRLSQRI